MPGPRLEDRHCKGPERKSWSESSAIFVCLLLFEQPFELFHFPQVYFHFKNQLSQVISIDQFLGRQTLRRRFASGSLLGCTAHQPFLGPWGREWARLGRGGRALLPTRQGAESAFGAAPLGPGDPVCVSLHISHVMRTAQGTC